MDIVDELRDWSEGPNTCEMCERAANEIERLRWQERRADVLAATIRELRDLITHDAETKVDFIARVRAILSADTDARVTLNAELTRLAEGQSGAAKRSES